jgi:transcriptional regulator with XRE-family HTH domain
MLNLSSQQQYSKLESGRKRFTHKIIDQICKSFEIQRDDFENERIDPIDFKSGENSLDVIQKEKKLLERICALQLGLEEYHKLVDLFLAKRLLEQELEIIKAKIYSYANIKNIYLDKNSLIMVEIKT